MKQYPSPADKPDARRCLYQLLGLASGAGKPPDRTGPDPAATASADLDLKAELPGEPPGELAVIG